MVDFAVKTFPIVVVPHPDPETIQLECGRIGDYFVVFGKGQYQTGDTVAYIPEDSIVPHSLLVEMELEGRLSGSQKNRVKAIKLRGQLSQGLVYPMPNCAIGEDVTELLGITKYEPILPEHARGDRWNARGMTKKYDIENIKMYPDVFLDGEEVVFTEKIHGSLCCMGKYDGTPIVASKGNSASGLGFKVDEGVNDSNWYVQQYRAYQTQLIALEERLVDISNVFYVFGEIYGAGIQDLHYDGTKKKQFRVFDIWVGSPMFGKFMDYHSMVEMCDGLFETVPFLYWGPFSKERLAEYTDGQSMIGDHIREGIVVKPVHEGKDAEIGRRILKSVSETYSLRKNKNRTDYQ